MKRLQLIFTEISLQEIVNGHILGCTLQKVINAMYKYNFEFEVSEYSDSFEVTIYDGEIDDDIILETYTVKK